MYHMKKWIVNTCVSLTLLPIVGCALFNNPDTSLKTRLLEMKEHWRSSYAQESNEADSLGSVIRTYLKAKENGPNKDHMYAVYSGREGGYGVKWYNVEDLNRQLDYAKSDQNNSQRNATQDSIRYEKYKYVLNENEITW